jgi:hypothetical protein
VTGHLVLRVIDGEGEPEDPVVRRRSWLEDLVLRQMPGLPSEEFGMLVRTLARICEDPCDPVLGRHPPCCDMIEILESGSSAIPARISDTAVRCRATATFIS